MFKHRLRSYLTLEPEVDHKFYCLLQELPGEERCAAFQNIDVREAVREALAQRLPTFILMLDIQIIAVVIACFGACVSWYNNYLFGDHYSAYCQTQSVNCVHPHLNILLWVVIGGGIYFLLRELMQALSLKSIGFFKTWWKDPTNYIDVVCIFIMLVWPSLMLNNTVKREYGTATKEVFRSLSTFSAGFLFILVFSFLKRVNIKIAVFVHGFIVVFYNLLTFLAVLCVIITAFATMFYAMFMGSIECGQFCTFWSSWFEVYTMILGNYQPNDIFGIDPYNYIFSRAVIYNSSNPIINGSASFDPSYSLSHDSKQYFVYFLYVFLIYLYHDAV